MSRMMLRRTFLKVLAAVGVGSGVKATKAGVPMPLPTLGKLPPQQFTHSFEMRADGKGSVQEFFRQPGIPRIGSVHRMGRGSTWKVNRIVAYYIDDSKYRFEVQYEWVTA